MSIAGTLDHSGLGPDAEGGNGWGESRTERPGGLQKILRKVSGVLVGPGFGPRGTEGKIAAVRYAREQGIPYFGICYGLHMAVIEIARDLVGLDGANSSEIDGEAPHKVIDLMPSQ